jgi:hypothetical protein
VDQAISEENLSSPRSQQASRRQSNNSNQAEKSAQIIRAVAQ